MYWLQQVWIFTGQKKKIMHSNSNENMLFWRKTDETIWKAPLSKRTSPSTNPPYLSKFFMTPLFVQILKTRGEETMVSFIGLSELFIKCISGAACAFDWVAGDWNFWWKISALFNLNKSSCLCCLSKFYCCILKLFLYSSSNYLEANRCLCLLKNPHLIMHSLRRSDTCQYQH